MKFTVRIVGLVILSILLMPGLVNALSSNQINVFNNGIDYFNTDASNTTVNCVYNTSGTGNTSSTASGLIWPFATKSSSQYNRVDQGWDIQADPGAAIYAIAPGTLHLYKTNPGGFGNDYPTEELDASIGGPSNWVYYGHVHILQSLVGQHVTAGQQIAVANTTDGQNGSAAPPGWLEIGFAMPGTDAPLQGGSEAGATQAGQDMKNLLLNAQPGANNSSNGSGSGTASGCTCTYSSSGGTTGSPSQSQIQIVKTILGVVKSENLGENAGLIALMTAIDESSLQILSNVNVPLSLSNPAATRSGSDHNSVGVFQQQPDQGWSTFATGPPALLNKNAVWQDMDPAFSTEAFLGTPPGATLPSGLANPGAIEKGLQDKPGWDALPPWVAAQDVQGSSTATGLNYKRYIPQAQSLLNQYWSSAQPVTLPIPLTGGSGGNNSSGGSISC